MKGSAERNMTPFLYLMHSFPTEREEDFIQLLHFVDDYMPSDFKGVGTWPFRLAQIQPGEIDMDFVRRFGIELLGGYGYEHSDLRVVFGNEPKWQSKWVNDDIKKERHLRITEHLKQWSTGYGLH